MNVWGEGGGVVEVVDGVGWLVVWVAVAVESAIYYRQRDFQHWLCVLLSPESCLACTSYGGSGTTPSPGKQILDFCVIYVEGIPLYSVLGGVVIHMVFILGGVVIHMIFILGGVVIHMVFILGGLVIHMVFILGGVVMHMVFILGGVVMHMVFCPGRVYHYYRVKDMNCFINMSFHLRRL